MVFTTSTNFISGTGLKNQNRQTGFGRFGGAADFVRLDEDVLLAKIVCGGQALSARLKVRASTVNLFSN